MRETKFIEQNQEKWADFERLLRDDRRDPEKLNNLFIQITDDLSYARTFYPNRSVRMYLNSLAQRVFHNIYRGKRFPKERLRRFWTDELPHILWLERRALWLSFALFLLACTAGVLSSRINPDFARIFLGEQYVEMTLENIERGDPMGVYKQSGPLGMTAGIAANNLYVALRTAIFGVLASIGTVFILLYNGIMVGVFQYFFIERGIFWESFLTIWVHGTLEISAIVVSGAAGLVAGSGLLFPGTYRRAQAFQISMRRGLKIFIGLAPMLALAAVFEGFLTRFTETPDAVRLLFILSSLALVIWYFFWLPAHKARSGSFHESVRDKELPAERREVIDFTQIKTGGEVLSDAFTVLRRHPRMLLLGIFATAGLYTTAFFVFSDEPMLTTIGFSSDLLGVLKGTDVFFRFAERPWLYALQLAIFAGLAAAAGRALEGEMDAATRPPVRWLRVAAAFAVLALLMPALFWVLQLPSRELGWLLAMLATPFVALWCAVVFFESLNPLRALLRTFALMRWSQGITLGFLTVNLTLALFLFLDFQVWQIMLRFFSWLVPPGEGHLTAFGLVATTWMASVLLYASFLLAVVSGGIQYFSLREINDASSLNDRIDAVGQIRQIRGLARE